MSWGYCEDPEYLHLLRWTVQVLQEQNLAGSRWHRVETEEIAQQTIIQTFYIYEQHGLAFAWRGEETYVGVDADAVRELLVDGCIDLSLYVGWDLDPPSNTALLEGIPEIIIPTPCLLQYVYELIMSQ